MRRGICRPGRTGGSTTVLEGRRVNNLLVGKVVVISGANRGIGRAIAEAMASQGAAVAAGARDQSSLDDLRDAVDRMGGRFIGLPCDVTDPNSLDSMAEAVLQQWGRVDAVVANAGVTGAVRPMHVLTYEQWRECIATDLDGVFITFRPFIASMIDNRRGSLIAISSGTGKKPLPNRTPYCAAKMGVIGLVRSLALELGPSGIRVNSVCPGAVDGERLRKYVVTQAVDQGISEDESLARFTDNAALKRTTEPHEVADACVFLASDLATGITGEDMNVSAGLIMY